jgi:hypothetical protein
MKRVIMLYSDGIGFPRLGWYLCVHRDYGGHGLGVFWHSDALVPGIYVGIGWCFRVEWRRTDTTNRRDKCLT